MIDPKIKERYSKQPAQEMIAIIGQTRAVRIRDRIIQSKLLWIVIGFCIKWLLDWLVSLL